MKNIIDVEYSIIEQPRFPLTVLNKIVKCKDGFEMSVQASKFHYSAPREDHAEEYHAVEVGFPSSPESLLDPYKDPTGEVYGWVPVSVVAEIVRKHGGQELPDDYENDENGSVLIFVDTPRQLE